MFPRGCLRGRIRFRPPQTASDCFRPLQATSDRFKPRQVVSTRVKPLQTASNRFKPLRCECANVRICDCANARMRKCANVRMCDCAIARPCDCANVCLRECANARVRECANARMCVRVCARVRAAETMYGACSCNYLQSNLALHGFPTVGVAARQSLLIPQNCKECPIPPALLRAWGNARIIVYQGTPICTGVPLQTTCPEGAGHAHGAQGVQPFAPLCQLDPHKGHRESFPFPYGSTGNLLDLNLHTAQKTSSMTSGRQERRKSPTDHASPRAQNHPHKPAHVLVAPEGVLRPAKCNARATLAGTRASSRWHRPIQKYM